MTAKQYRTVPTYTEDLVQKGATSASYYRYLQDLNLGTPPAAEASVVVTASPFAYTAPQGGALIIQGGSVSQVTFTRTTTSYVTGQTSGMFPVSKGDMLTITYASAPTMTFVPQ